MKYTFTPRMYEVVVNIKAMNGIPGHEDAEITKELKKSELIIFLSRFSQYLELENSKRKRGFMLEIWNSFIAFWGSILQYAQLLSFAVALMALIVSIANNLRNNRRAKEEKRVAEERYNEQKEQYEARLTAEKAKREEDKKIADEYARINEQPYLVFKGAERIDVIPSASGTQIVFSMSFVNKGRGSAYSIIPDLDCTASHYGDTFKVHRFDVVEDPIAMVGEYFIVKWSYIGEEIYGYRMPFSIKYKDASGREYMQNYIVDIISEKESTIITYAEPKLCDNQTQPVCN